MNHEHEYREIPGSNEAKELNPLIEASPSAMEFLFEPFYSFTFIIYQVPIYIYISCMYCIVINGF